MGTWLVWFYSFVFDHASWTWFGSIHSFPVPKLDLVSFHFTSKIYLLKLVFIPVPCSVPENLKCVEGGMVMKMIIVVVEMMSLED